MCVGFGGFVCLNLHISPADFAQLWAPLSPRVQTNLLSLPLLLHTRAVQYTLALKHMYTDYQSYIFKKDVNLASFLNQILLQSFFKTGNI